MLISSPCSLDEPRRSKGLTNLLEPSAARSNRVTVVKEATGDDTTSSESKESEMVKLKPSQLPLMNQVERSANDFEEARDRCQ